jgi:hypothetical protein
VTSTAPPRPILVELDAKTAATTLGALVGRREHLAERLAARDEYGFLLSETRARWRAGLERELADVEAAEAALRRALQVRT